MAFRVPTSRLPLVLTALGVTVVLAACATSPAEKAGLKPRVSEKQRDVEFAALNAPKETSLYGLFLAGEAALQRGSINDASFFLSKASDAVPDPYLRERAFTAAVMAGDIPKAAATPLTPGDNSAPAERLARVVRAVEELADNKGADALTILRAEKPDGPTAQAVTLLIPWAAAEAGDMTLATSVPPVIASAPQLTTLSAAFSRARLLERAGRLADAEVVFRSLTVNADNLAFVIGYGGFLERHGRRNDAVALYDRALMKARDPDLIQARDRAKANRGAPAQPTLQEGAGEALLAPAATLVARRQPEVGLALMRMALRLDPKLDDAWLFVGDSMSAAGDMTSAREAYARVPPSSSKYAAAQGRLAWSLQRSGDGQGALKLAREALDRQKGDLDALTLYADLLRENGRFEDSIEAMDKIIARETGDADLWRLYYLRAVAYDRSGRWDKAETDLQQAYKLNPNDPEVMNYLGFGWANRYQHLDQALDLLQKAATLRPRSGEIRDSLGWVKYRLGKYPDAVRDLERAVALSPAEPDINDHLGDAYWQVGRKLEAGYQWTRVLSLAPDDVLKASVDVKLKSGLGAPGAVAAVAPATSVARP